METSRLLSVSSPVGMCISLSVSRDYEQSIPCCPFPDWLSLTSKPSQFLSKTNKTTSLRRVWRHEAGHNLPCGLPSILWRYNPQTSPSSEASHPQWKTNWYKVQQNTSTRHSTLHLLTNNTANLKHCQCRLPWVSSQGNLYKCTGEMLYHFPWKQRR